MNKSKHAPLVIGLTGVLPNSGSGVYEIQRGDEVVAENLGIDDAILMVRAINAYDDLVAALQKLLEHAPYADVSCWSGQQYCKAKYQARAALAKVKGES